MCATPRKSALSWSRSRTPSRPLCLRSWADCDTCSISSARPDVIAAHLMQDTILAGAVARNPGLRVPGAFDGFEIAVRAILGQQITVKGATTLAGRFSEAFGEPVETPHPGLSRLSPTPQRVAAAQVEDVAALGIVRTRAHSIVTLAEEVASGRLKLEAGAPPEATIKQLIALPGIGNWTAHYIAMRALRWPDAFPKEDLALRNSLAGVTAAQAEALSQAWRPWRSYATLHLWQSNAPPALPNPTIDSITAPRASASVRRYLFFADMPKVHHFPDGFIALRPNNLSIFVMVHGQIARKPEELPIEADQPGQDLSYAVDGVHQLHAQDRVLAPKSQ